MVGRWRCKCPHEHKRSLYDGTYSSERILEFLVQDVEIEFARAMPFHINGDGVGFRRKVKIKVSDFEPEILDFRD
jgi:hypothetical protein